MECGHGLGSETRNKYSMYVAIKDFIFHSFCNSLAVFQLSVRSDGGTGLLSKKWTGEGGGLKLAKMRIHPLWMTPKGNLQEIYANTNSSANS